MFKKRKIASAVSRSESSELNMDISRRRFLINSSMVSAASMIPLSGQAAAFVGQATPTAATSLSLENLINILPYAYQSNFNNERVNFGKLADEAQYIANRMLTEIMKAEMYNHYSVIHEFNGKLDPDWAIYNQAGVSSVHSQFQSLITEVAPIYVSQILQEEYAATDDINNYSPQDRRALNAWDMIKANAQYNTTKSTHAFNELMSKLYSLAIDHAQEPFSTYLPGSSLKAYKDSNYNYHWGKQLFNYYNSEAAIQAVVEDNKISNSTDDTLHVAEKFAKVQAIFSKLRCLAYTDASITEEQIDDLEGKYFGALILGLAQSIKIGAKSEPYSLRNNRKVHIDTMNELLKPESATRTFWERFVNEYGNGSVEIAHTMIYNQASSADTMGALGPNFISRLKSQYPMFNEVGSSGRARVMGAVHGEAALYQFLLGIALGHFIYTTVEEGSDEVNIPELISFSSAVVDAGKGVLYLVLVTQIRNYFLGELAGVAQTGGPLGNAAKFYLNFARNYKSVQKVETKIITQIFMKSKIASIAERVSLVFGVAALGVAAYSLADAIINGDIAGIVFETVNTLIGLGGVMFGALALAGMSMAGPIAVALAVVGGIVAIVQWLWEMFGPKHIPPSPIQNYTNKVVKPNGFYYPSAGYFLAAKTNSDGRGQLFQFHVNELLWENGGHSMVTLDDSISDAGAVCSHGSYVYIYDDHATNGIPQVLPASLTSSPQNLYDDWTHYKSDLIRSVKCVAVHDDYAYGLCRLTDYSEGMYRWLAGQRPPTESDRMYITASDHPATDKIQWICSTGSKVWAVSKTRLYEITGNSITQKAQFRSNEEEKNIVEVNVCTDNETLYITTSSRAVDYNNDPDFAIMTAIVTNQTNEQGGLYQREMFSSQAPLRMTTVAHTVDTSRTEFISMTDERTQRQGALLKAQPKDLDKSLDFITGVTFPNSDGGWNGCKLLSNVTMRS
ncbi:hypothetical protein KCM76_20790 [Zooshikella marina]|uniref:DUF5336 domain-containing protein n=1 Tax=Zooshikella ganghwensis TaxID=202772 RepID=UPI001BAE65A0|nr:DUF5336 domain-containing protein [Zooshikella ganghwensis]MBU2708443.1 hypothetical protein [Zooshikella ganghwensis]